jgi:hypothetical protein
VGTGVVVAAVGAAGVAGGVLADVPGGLGGMEVDGVVVGCVVEVTGVVVATGMVVATGVVGVPSVPQE